MAIAALITWSGAVLLGLYMLTVWLIENDVSARGESASQLPPAIVFLHMFLALGGLAVWASYVLLDRRPLAWTAFGVQAVIVTLGTAMFARWIPVYRGPDETGLVPSARHARPQPVEHDPWAPAVPAGHHGAGHHGAAVASTVPTFTPDGPPESNFPMVVVVGHGLLATATFTLVLLTALGVGGG